MIRVGLDIGNSKISCVVCDKKTNGKIEILSVINHPTINVKKSLIIDIKKISKEIEEVLIQSEKESQTKIASVRLNVSIVNSLNKFISNQIFISNEKISDLHLKKFINNSDILEPIEDYEVIYRSIVNYELDKETVTNPRGMYGETLKVLFYKLAVKQNHVKSLKNIFEKINIEIESFIPTPLSSALAILSNDEKELGSISIDFGAGSTSICVFKNNKVVFLDAIPIGSKHITNDIARGIQTTLESAERLKNLYGSVITNPSDDYEFIDVPNIASNVETSKQINRSELNSIIKPRVEETLEILRQKLKEYSLDKRGINNLVITGGGSLLEGIEEYSETIFDSKTRVGKPLFISGLNKEKNVPQIAQTIGLSLYNENEHDIDFLPKNIKNKEKNTLFKRFSSWLDEFI
ncbi:MAG: Cell division protein FtsA [Alphaproteobacteria bacterium MarineAlpha5_Bin9]|nr:MAG: Cell division protein FtsA [Alphaproteobacteria bacterium MarineAlpha5_Bin9]|tara:strand:- start:1642 stop:2862 length:1221 start_codon:yes stop_codon:yes gene_type:complete